MTRSAEAAVVALQKGKYDVVVLDVGLPEVSGLGSAECAERVTPPQSQC